MKTSLSVYARQMERRTRERERLVDVVAVVVRCEGS